MVGPTVLHPQYYGVQAPWGIYPTNLIQQQGQQTPQGLSSQQQQQQIIRSQSGRPLTPSQQNDNVSSQPLNPQVPSKYDIRQNMTYFLYSLNAQRHTVQYADLGATGCFVKKHPSIKPSDQTGINMWAVPILRRNLDSFNHQKHFIAKRICQIWTKGK